MEQESSNKDIWQKSKLCLRKTYKEIVEVYKEPNTTYTIRIQNFGDIQTVITDFSIPD